MLHIISGHVDKWDNSDSQTVGSWDCQTGIRIHINDHLGTGVKTMKVPRREAPWSEITLKSYKNSFEILNICTYTIYRYYRL